MKTRWAWGVALAAVVGASAAAAESAPSGVDGTWRLVSTRQVMANGTVRPAPDVGPRPAGYMMYDAAAGRVCTVFNDTTRPPWASAQPSEVELRTAWERTAIYCGRFHVDEARKVIIFDYEIGLSPSLAGTSRERRFERNGDNLTIYPMPLPTGVTAATVHLERVRR